MKKHPSKPVPSRSVLLTFAVISLGLAGICGPDAVALDTDSTIKGVPSQSQVQPSTLSRPAKAAAKVLSYKGCVGSGFTYSVSGEGLDEAWIRCAAKCGGKDVSASVVSRSRSELTCRLKGDFPPGCPCIVGVRDGYHWLIERRVRACPATRASTPPKQPAPPTAGASPRVAAVLKAIESSRTADDLRTALKAHPLSQGELAELHRHIANQAVYRDKLMRLQKAEAALPSKYPTQPPVNVKQLAQKRQVELDRLHRQTLDRAQVQVANLRARAARDRGASPSRSSERTAVADPALRRQMDTATVARITSVTPTHPRLGQNVTISGSGFGSTPGRVVLLIGSSLVPCDRVVDWRDDRVVATIPTAAAPVVHDVSKPARIWVKLAGSELGPHHDLTLETPPELLKPAIHDLSTNEVTAEQRLLILGHNFLASERGRVDLQLVGKTFPAIVNSWQDDMIEVTIPYIIQILRESGSLVVTNRAGQQARVGITYKPVIWSYGEYNPDVEPFGIYHVSCSPKDTYLGWYACVWGDMKKIHYRERFMNGFRIIGAQLTEWEHLGIPGAKCGAYIENPPPVVADHPQTFGTTYVDIVNVLWANGWAECEFLMVLELEGPAVMDPHRIYDPTRACIDDRWWYEATGIRNYYSPTPGVCVWDY